MHIPEDARAQHADRLRAIRGRWAVADVQAAKPNLPRRWSGRSVRRVVGRAFIRVGLAIEPGPRRPVAS